MAPTRARAVSLVVRLHYFFLDFFFVFLTSEAGTTTRAAVAARIDAFSWHGLNSAGTGLITTILISRASKKVA